MPEIVFMYKYKLSNSVSWDIKLKDCIPAGYVVSEILITNKNNSAVTINININDEYTLPDVEIEAKGYAVINPNKKYFATKSAFLELTSSNWNNSMIGLQMLMWKV
jgi:hypothetical protein